MYFNTFLRSNLSFGSFDYRAAAVKAPDRWSERRFNAITTSTFQHAQIPDRTSHKVVLLPQLTLLKLFIYGEPPYNKT